MIRSIEWLRRRVHVRAFAPALLFIVGVPTHPDPVGKRATGYAGVIPIPAGPVATQPSATRPDATPEARHDPRADRGRVLYAAGHAPTDTVVARPHRHPCLDQRLGQTAPPTTAPNS